MFLIVSIILITGCSSTGKIISEETQYGSNNQEKSVDYVPKVLNEFERYQSTKKFFRGASNTLYEIQINLLSAGYINISGIEYFRIDFSVKNHRNIEEEFNYGAFIYDGQNRSIASVSEIGYLKPNQTKNGYIQFRNFRSKADIFELEINGGYKPRSSYDINFNFRIAFQRKGRVLEQIPLDFYKTAVVADKFVSVKIIENAPYNYEFQSEKAVSVEFWPTDTVSGTIISDYSTHHSSCSTKLQVSGSKDCVIFDTPLLLTIKRI